MNRREFLKRLGIGTAAVALSPMLDLAEIIEAPSIVQQEYVTYISYVFNLYVSNPRQLGVITSISEP